MTRTACKTRKLIKKILHVMFSAGQYRSTEICYENKVSEILLLCLYFSPTPDSPKASLVPVELPLLDLFHEVCSSTLYYVIVL